jgi:ABC-type multidrug transport system ATPase subunit
MITTSGLIKRYGSLTAVNEVDLLVRPGDIYGFLGANGSGKTTTVRMLLGLVLPTAGSIELLGESMPKHARQVLPKVGALVEGPAAYGHLSGRVNLTLFDRSGPSGPDQSTGSLSRAEKVDEVLARVGLADVGRRPVKAYSLGMRQRLGLAAALLRRPQLLILDEPTNGLDPQGIREIRDLLLELHAQGTTIFLSSHLLAEVEQLCTRVGVLDRGRLVLQEQLDVLRRPTGRTIVDTPDVGLAAALLGSRISERREQSLFVNQADSAALNAELVAAGIPVTGLRTERPSLEDVVLAATEPSSGQASAA